VLSSPLRAHAPEVANQQPQIDHVDLPVAVDIRAGVGRPELRDHDAQVRRVHDAVAVEVRRAQGEREEVRRAGFAGGLGIAEDSADDETRPEVDIRRFDNRDY